MAKLQQEVEEKMKILSGNTAAGFEALDYLGNELFTKYIDDQNKIVEICEKMIGCKLLDVFSSIWDKYFTSECYEYESDISAKMLLALKVLFWNYSDKCKTLCERISKSKEIIPRLLEDLKQVDDTELSKDYKRHHVKATLAILHNLLRHCKSNKKVICENEGKQTILRFNKSEYLIVKTYVAIVLAYCLENDEMDQLGLDLEVCKFILKLLSSASESGNHVYCLTSQELMDGMHNLASTDKNKKLFFDAGVMTLLLRILKRLSEDELVAVLHCLNRLIRLPDVTANEDMRNNIKSAVKSLNGQGEIKQLRDQILFYLKENPTPIGKHVMISYQWNFQEQMLQVCEYLEKEGFTVWMDKNNMADKISNTLAKAIDEAQVVLAAISSSYERSKNCESEYKHASQQNRPILPVKVERGYNPKGWLSMKMGDEIYVDISQGVSEEKLKEIKERLLKKGATVRG